ncbi:MAG: outer membrane protein assembly factor BamA [Limnohabitans sp.]|jgi:outer membrane protein insertion porin family|nr:outer membrane protein assembly factor BamA [Limnohabitans sp.]
MPSYHKPRSRLSPAARCVALALGLSFGVPSWAVEPFKIQDIRVEGLQRVEPGTVFATLPIRVGDDYSDDKGAAAIRSLFALGLFNDIRIETRDGVVVLIIEERPVIGTVDFIGTKEFDKDVLRKALRDIGLAEGRAFDKSLADRAEQELKRQYVNRSLYGAEVITTITPLDRNRVNLSFTVVEGQTAKIKELRIVGARAISESTLIDQMDLSVGNWLSWYTKSDRYSRAKLNADLETLRAYYQARGFLEFRVESTQVAISPNKQDISLTIHVHEGERFTVSEVALEGYYLGRDDEFKSLVGIKVGEPYNADQVAQTTKAFGEYFGNFGFAFARTEVRPEIDRERNLVKLVLVADPSRRAYVRRINVLGNTRTRDQIVRREFRQMESAWYDGAKIRLSRDRVDRLGFFKEVGVETLEVPGSPDQVDLNVNITEKPTGMLTLGAGFSSYEKLTLNFGVQQDNVFGTGQSLGLNISTSKFNRFFVLSNTDPYFTPDGISRTLEYSHRSSIPFVTQAGNYRLATDALSLRFGIPFSELDRVFVGVGYEAINLTPGTNMPTSWNLFLGDHPDGKTQFYPITVGWARDSRDSLLNPSRGSFVRLNGEYGTGQDARYVRYGAQYQEYFSLGKKYTLAYNVDLGLGRALGDTRFPVSKNLYAGGLGSVRGFEQGSVGPRDDQGYIAGGTKRVVVNTEVLAPFPGAGNDRSLRLYGFFDVGTVYAAHEKVDFATMRSSYGLGLSWVSPMGPLRLAWARPLRTQPGDRIQPLQFQIGTSF